VEGRRESGGDFGFHDSHPLHSALCGGESCAVDPSEATVSTILAPFAWRRLFSGVVSP
jgi:hypothetical protein